MSQLESWISQNQDIPRHGNPIEIHQTEDFPPDADWHPYYRFFELAMRYLLDIRGMGKSLQDVLHLFYDLRNGILFPESFQNHFGISVSDFEDEFYGRMRTYLKYGYIPLTFKIRHSPVLDNLFWIVENRIDPLRG